MEPHGKAAEHVVAERLRAALASPEFRLYPNAEWLGPMREGGPARDGEADLVVVHEEHGILVLEVKSGTPSRDSQGRWWIGGHQLDRDPFDQARDSKHQLVRKLEALPDWPPRTRAARRSRDRPARRRPGQPAARPRPARRRRPARARP